ncbi:MAG: ABC transporter substrate-binding protein [Thermomicrobiales bacterium]
MAEYWNLERLASEWEARGLDRRELLRLVAGGAGMSAMLALLGARPQGAAAAAAQDATGGGQISVLWRKPIIFNPLFSTSGNEQQVERLLFGALVKMSDVLVPTPDLASEVQVSDDASVYTFILHQNITFSDGQPLTAKDVVFTIERAVDKRTASYWRGRLLGIEGAEAYGEGQADSISGLATPDDYTVQITLAQPDSAFLVNLGNFSGLGIIPQHILGEVAPDQLQAHEFSMEPTVTAGAFKFVRHEVDQFLEIERNPSYFGDPPPLERMFLKILTPDVGLTQLETGELNLMTLPVSEAERVRGIEGVTVLSVPSPSMSFLSLNMERPYLQNKQMRQAMAYAIDRENILQQVYQGEGEVVNSPIFGPDWMGTPEGLNLYPYDPEKAKAMLDESGVDKSQEILFMTIPGNSKEGDAAVAIIQEQLNQVGFNIGILQVDVAESGRRFVQETDFDMNFGGGGVFRADPSVSGTYFTTSTFTPNGGNYSHYSNPQIDELYVQGRAVKDLEERKRVYTEIAVILNDELPWIPLWSPNSLYAISNNFQGFAPPSYIDNKFWNAETWSVTE